VYSTTEKTISGVDVSPGSAETLIKSGITNKHSIVYSLSNISTKIYQNQLIRVEVIMSVVSETQCRICPVRNRRLTDLTAVFCYTLQLESTDQHCA